MGWSIPIRWGVISRNVAALTRGPKAHRHEGRTLTPNEARKLLTSLKGHRNEALYALMLSTGLRRGEALGLRWEDIDLKTGVLVVTRQLKREGGSLVTSDTKTAQSRRALNLPAPMVAALRQHKAGQTREPTLMTTNEVAAKPERTVQAGAVESRRRGMSWTTDPIVAEKFAERRPILVRGRIVYRQRQLWQVTVPPKAVLARIDGRRESEVIVNPRMLPRDW